MGPIKKLLHNLEEIVSGIFIAITVLSVTTNVLLRSIANITVSGIEEVATISFIWSVYIGAAACYKKKMHIGVDFLVALLPRTFQHLFKILIDAFLCLLIGTLFYLSVIFTGYSLNKPTSVLGISSAYVNSALIVSFALILIYSFKFLWDEIKSLITSSDRSVEEILEGE